MIKRMRLSGPHSVPTGHSEQTSFTVLPSGGRAAKRKPSSYAAVKRVKIVSQLHDPILEVSLYQISRHDCTYLCSTCTIILFLKT